MQFVVFYWKIVKETRGLNDMELYALYLNDEQKAAIMEKEVANAE